VFDGNRISSDGVVMLLAPAPAIADRRLIDTHSRLPSLHQSRCHWIAIVVPMRTQLVPGATSFAFCGRLKG
jgi:hypothetical protein